MLENVGTILGLGPSDYHRWNLSNLAHLLLVFDTKLEVVQRGNKWFYGELPGSGATLSKHADIMNWLMNEAECPTTWEPLLQIRRANPNYDATRRPVY